MKDRRTTRADSALSPIAVTGFTPGAFGPGTAAEVAFIGRGPFSVEGGTTVVVTGAGFTGATSVAFNDQQPTMEGQPGITVGHENLRVGVGLRQATSHSEVLVRSTRLAATNVLAGYS